MRCISMSNHLPQLLCSLILLRPRKHIHTPKCIDYGAFPFLLFIILRTSSVNQKRCLNQRATYIHLLLPFLTSSTSHSSSSTLLHPFSFLSPPPFPPPLLLLHPRERERERGGGGERKRER